MDSWKKRWGVNQWAAYFENQALPVMRRSKVRLMQMESAEGEMLAPNELSEIVLQDPLLCLCLLREAELKKSHRLDHETTTALAAIMQLGVEGFRHLLFSCPEVDETNAGLLRVEARASLASQIASIWAAGRMDLNPEEVALSALLAGTGDLLLWVYVPEIPQNAEEELRAGRARRSAQAQQQTCGFTFKELTLQCAIRWKLPALVILLLRGSESVRAKLTRTCSNAARHILDESPTSTLALASDLDEAARLIPSVDLSWLVDSLTMVPEDRRAEVLEKAQALQSSSAS